MKLIGALFRIRRELALWTMGLGDRARSRRPVAAAAAAG
jgi:hypothetical protein